MGSWWFLLIGALIIILLFIGSSAKLFRFIGQLSVKAIVGALFLFLFNSLTMITGLFVPINVATTAVVALLGLPGMILLVALQQFVL